MGEAAISRCVYGCVGHANNPAVAPCSTTSPRSITAIVPQYRAASPRSCVISIIAMPRSATSPANRSITVRCVVTSSPVVGSSAISRCGSQAIAIAIITRWHIPPESSAG